MSQVTAVNIDAGCEVLVRGDSAGDVAAHLKRNLLKVNLIEEEAPSHDMPEGGVTRLLVQMEDGDALSAGQVFPILKENTDFDVISEEEFEADMSS